VEALWTSRQCGLAPFVSCQDEYSLLMRRAEHDKIPMMRACNLGLLPVLSARQRTADRQVPAEHAAAIRRAPGRARRRYPRPLHQRFELAVVELWKTSPPNTPHAAGTRLQLLAAQPVVSSVIAGATRPEQVEANVHAADWELTPEDLMEIDRRINNLSRESGRGRDA